MKNAYNNKNFGGAIFYRASYYYEGYVDISALEELSKNVYCQKIYGMEFRFNNPENKKLHNGFSVIEYRCSDLRMSVNEIKYEKFVNME